MGDYNIDPEAIEAAISPRTRALMFAHTLGNPADMSKIMPLVKKHNLLLIEDTADALGSKFDGQMLGTFGQIATLSFLSGASHHHGGRWCSLHNQPAPCKRLRAPCGIGAVIAGAGMTIRLMVSAASVLDREIDGVEGHYDHRYYYTEIGLQLKITDPQAAMGVAQLAKLPGFVAARKRNFKFLYEALGRYSEFLVMPEWHPLADTSWFCVPAECAARCSLCTAVTSHDFSNIAEVETRLLFAGNILRQAWLQGY
ncbi:lipopolysaccharide biosynthesis protein RfbH [Chloroflexota bacterium]|nr:lipopolysaccharide biosynthesis protein RfbH [Chloroflexota bacterium]